HLGGRDHLANRPLHIGESRGGFLDTHADGRAHVQQDLATVDLREKIAAKKWREQERDGDEAEKARDEEPALRDGERQQLMIPGAQSRKALLEAVLKAHQRALRRRGLRSLALSV